MDSVTQILLGSSVAASIAPKESRKRALIAGALLGTLPDLDVLIRYSNEIDNFTSHRGFSHSLLVLPLLSIALVPPLQKAFPSLTRTRLYFLIAATLVTHALLDSLTAYGTQLLWPLPVTPTYLSSIFIIDPLYSLCLFFGLLAYALSPKLSWANKVGLLLSTLYLCLGFGMQNLAKDQLAEAFPQTTKDRWFVGALTGSPLGWHGVYLKEDHYIEVIFNTLNPQEMAIQKYPLLPSSKHPKSKDFQRLQWFNPDTILREEGDTLTSSDLRMGEFGIHPFEFIIQPTSESGTRLPLLNKNQTRWQPDEQNQHAKAYLERYGKLSFPQRKWLQFLRCLEGKF